MGRFESLSHSPFDTRRVLRDRLVRHLRPVHERGAVPRVPGSGLSDLVALELLLKVHISSPWEVAGVRTSYESYRSAHPGAPTLDDLIQDGWLAIAWGRVTWQLSARVQNRQQSDPVRRALQAIFDGRPQRAFTFANVSLLPPSAQAFANSLITDPDKVATVACPSPDWVAARLWERRPADLTAPCALRWWVDRWLLLGHPQMAPTAWWAEADARLWRSAASTVLRDESDLASWEMEWKVIDAIYKRWAPNLRSATYAELPATLVGRYLWLHLHEGQAVDHWGRAYEVAGDLWAVVQLLCDDLAAHDRLLSDPSSAEFLDIVAGAPALVVLLVTRLHQLPVLLADVLLHPPTSALGCLLIGEWSASLVSAWERSLQVASNIEVREHAFDDAISISVHLVPKGLRIEELSALFVWLHGRARADAIAHGRHTVSVTPGMFESLRRELLTLDIGQLQSAFAALSFDGSQGLGTARFTAALDLLSMADLAIDAESAHTAVATYVGSFASGTWLDLVGLTPRQAATLAGVARKSTIEDTFLAPFDVRQRLAEAKATTAEYTAQDEIARALRAHIRVLSRAVAGSDDRVPDELVDALAATIRSAASDHAEKGRVSAFAARFEAGVFVSRAEPPLARDVAAACVRLTGAQLAKVEAALFLVDEPLLFAGLLEDVPTSMRQRLVDRVNALVPDDAGETHSLPEVQGRIDQLLSVGATELAATYMEVERNLRTFGQVPGRALVRFRFELRLALARGDFAQISAAVVPPGTGDQEIASFKDSISFYRGLAELESPTGSPSSAAQIFGTLARQHPENSAYAINLFVARVSELLSGDVFRRFSTEEKTTAARAIEEVERSIIDSLGEGDANTSRIRDANEALLLLAMGRPEHAYQVLRRDLRPATDRTAAYTSVALARMGRTEEAVFTLDAAQRAHGETPILNDARQHISHGARAAFRLQVVSDDARIATVRGALTLLRGMEPTEQAEALRGGSGDDLVIHEVRSAASAVTALVPMMRGTKLDSCEDDLNSLLAQILEARVHLFGWSVADQSKGGYSAKGNPGERDIIIKKEGFVVTVVEALVCDSNPATETAKKALRSHFQKLFGYEACRFFFHVVYSYHDDPTAVLEVMRGIARADAPGALSPLPFKEIPHEDSRPVGFEATYRDEGGRERKVICLVLDMAQKAARDAAAAAGRTRSTNVRPES